MSKGAVKLVRFLLKTCNERSPGVDVKLTWFPAWLCVSRARSTWGFESSGSGFDSAKRAYNVLYLYKMNRLGQVLGEGCTRMWETILPRAIATFCRWGNIVLFTFYLTNNSEVQPTLPQCSLWSIYRDRMSTLDVPLRTSCAPRLVATSVLLVIFQKMGNLLELLRCKTINNLQLNSSQKNAGTLRVTGCSMTCCLNHRILEWQIKYFYSSYLGIRKASSVRLFKPIETRKRVSYDRRW